MIDHPHRCAWVKLTNPVYVQYHDEEWGVPVYDDQKHFEFLILEGAQAGLSWETVLSRRDHYREAFAGFDPNKVANFGEKDLEQLLQNPGLIRNRQKLKASIRNAQAFLEIQKEFGNFTDYIWQFVGGKPKIEGRQTIKDVPAVTPESVALSKDLKKRGMNFVGPTIVYAHMQATGLVNDHTVDCFRYQELLKNCPT